MVTFFSTLTDEVNIGHFCTLPNTFAFTLHGFCLCHSEELFGCVCLERLSLLKMRYERTFTLTCVQINKYIIHVWGTERYLKLWL